MPFCKANYAARDWPVDWGGKHILAYFSDNINMFEIFYLTPGSARRNLIYRQFASLVMAKKKEILRKRGALNRASRRVRDELFREHEFFDAEDLVQVKYEMLRRVLHEEESISDAAKLFGFSRPSFYKARLSFEEKGLVGLVPEKRGPRGAHKLSSEIVEFVEQAMEKDEGLDTGGAVELIEKKFAVRVHRRSVERALLRKKKRKRQ